MPRDLRRSAYALLISLLILSVLISLGIILASLTSIFAAGSKRDFIRARARLNAIAAARIATGELQTTLGPDKRVTAPASILIESEEKPPPQPWCGVWRTDRLAAEKPGAISLVHRDDSGALVDDRFMRMGNRPYNRKTERLRWLVSDESRDPFETASASAILLDDETASGPAVRIQPTIDTTEGGFAWWASDENQKSRIQAFDTSAPKTGSRSSRDPRNATGYALLPGWRVDGARPTYEPLSQESIAATGLIDPKALQKLRHDITTESWRVLTDVVRGGFCRDLTPYLAGLHRNSETNDDTPILTESPSDKVFAVHGPKLGMLRTWANIRSTAGLTPATGSRHASTSGIPSKLFHDGTHPDLPDASAPLSPVIAPVITEAAVYRRLSYEPGRKNAAGAPWIRLHLHPRIVFWNPYADTLKAGRYLVHLRINGSPEFRLVQANKTITGSITGWRLYTPSLVNYAVTQGTLLFVIDCPAIPPGESRLFLPARTEPLYGKQSGVTGYNPVANRLVSDNAPGAANFYLEDTDAFEDKGLNALAGVSLTNEKWRIENAAAEDFAVAVKSMDGQSLGTWAGLRTIPTLRYLSASLKCGYGTTPTQPWPVGVTEPLGTNLEATPPKNSRDGIRLRRFHETNANRAAYAPGAHMDIAPIADNNPLAVFQFIHPFANSAPTPTSGNRRVDKFGIFTRDEFDAEVDWTAFTPTGVIAHPFGLPSQFPKVSTMVLAGAPESATGITSAADLAYAPLVPYTWHPLRTIGESRCSPLAPADRTAWGNSAESLIGLPPALPNALRIDEAPESLLVYDLRYELNRALWDKFTWIGGTEAERREFARSPTKTPQCSPFLAHAGAEIENALCGPDAINLGPSAVALTGAFNINSTSIVAWKCFLASTRGLGPDSSSKGAVSNETPYARFPYNPGRKATEATMETSPEFGHGYRVLTDRNIDTLAQLIVDEIKLRGPFLGIADFVNRRLTDDPVQTDPDNISPNACGTLQAAIDKSGINPLTRQQNGLIERQSALPGSKYGGERQAHSRFEGTAAVLSQADLLRTLGPMITARGDTFKIIVAGCVFEGGDTIIAKAEVIIRRTPEPLRIRDGGREVPVGLTADRFGRRFETVSWRWMGP